MAFGKRAYCEFYDYFHVKWTVEIYLDGYTSNPSIFTGGAEPLSFRFGPGGDVETVLKDTECTVNIVQKVGEDYGWLNTDDDRKIKVVVIQGENEVTSTTSMLMVAGQKTLNIKAGLPIYDGQAVSIIRTDHATTRMLGYVLTYNIITGLAVITVTSVEGTGTYDDWYLEFTPTIGVYYKGWIIANQYIDDLGYVKSMTVTFSDQLRLLSAKLFTVNGKNDPTDSSSNLYTGKQTILNQLVQALDKTDLDFNINIASNLYESKMDSEEDYDEPFTQVDVWQDLWFDDNFVPGDCAMVIEELLRPFGCRIFQANGEWWICRVTELTGSSIKYRKFTSTGTLIHNTSVDYTLYPRIVTSTSLQKFTPYFQRLGGEISFLPEWKYREIQLDYGKRNSIVTSLIIDGNSLETSLNADWTNSGNYFSVLGNVQPSTVTTEALGSYLHADRFISSPLTPIYSTSKYVFKLLCGKHSDFDLLNIPTKPSKCCIALRLHPVVGDDYYYIDIDNKRQVPYWYQSEYAPGYVDETLCLTKISFTETPDPRVLPEQSLTVEAPPVDGQLEIIVYVPFLPGGGSLTYYYYRDLSFSIFADPDAEVVTGKVYSAAINENAFTIPEPVRLRISDGIEAVTGLYLGGMLSHESFSLPTSTWIQKGISHEIFKPIFDWYVLNQYEQHYFPNRKYDGSFIGLASMWMVLKITEFGNLYFIMDDVEYSVKSSIWSGTFLEVIQSMFNWDYDIYVLKSNGLPISGGNTVIMTGGGLATNPGGSTYQMQLNNNGEFVGAETVTYDGNHLKVGAVDTEANPDSNPEATSTLDIIGSSGHTITRIKRS